MLENKDIDSARLGDLCDIVVGMPLSRARRIPEGSSGEAVGVITQKTLTADGIDLEEVSYEVLGQVRKACITSPGDVIVKLTTPYDCAYINSDCAGLLVISAAAILRPRTRSVNMRWIAAILGTPQLKGELRLASIGASIQMIKKSGLANLVIPVPSVEKQERVASVCEQMESFKSLCRRSMRLADTFLAASVSAAAFHSEDIQSERNGNI